MKYYWIALIMKIKTVNHQEYVVCLQDEGGREHAGQQCDVGNPYCRFVNGPVLVTYS